MSNMLVNKFGEFRNVECGLISIVRVAPLKIAKIGEPIPLASVSVTASVINSVAQVEITQVYANKETTSPIELIYYFPLDSKSSVIYFQVEVDGKVIRNLAKEDVDRLIKCENLIKEKKNISPSSEMTPHIFKVPIGLIEAACVIKVNISYENELKIDNGSKSMKLVIPTTIVPHYLPPLKPVYKILTRESLKRFQNSSPGKISQLSTFILKTCGRTQDTTSTGNAYGLLSEIEPKKMNPVHMTAVCQSLGSLTIQINIASHNNIISVTSPSHKIEVEQRRVPFSGKSEWTSRTPNSFVVVFNGKITDMNRDFVLLITPIHN